MLHNSLSYLQKKLNGLEPDTAIILGSGLGGLITALQNPVAIPYCEIPDFPQTTVAGHQGCFYTGTIGTHQVLCMQGRFHLYEGIQPQLIAEIIKMFKQLGVRQLILTNAAGSLYKNMPAGSVMMINDHINMSGKNPLLGPHDEPYFPDLSHVYDEQMRQKFKVLAQEENIKLYEGVYIMVLGPNYETPAEVRLFRLFGADAVGMSTVPEAITGAWAGMKVAGFSVISNLGTGLSDEEANHQEVLTTVEKSAQKLGKLIQTYLEKE